ncbi:unnamed protein product [Heligmosomoides polygyrus]|uniref:Uncharacterized protein n=1 Tax=Heligmosomoides polygyrus TaxID=6339 RepID=A0A183FP72_HELPZ|nr:unnamed protein product [Heligmosomoides polygyrus]
MRRKSRVDQRSTNPVALGELKRMRKGEGQSVADFCVELDRLTRQAYSELDDDALDTERAHLLYEQLAHWRDACYLIEALESENGADARAKRLKDRTKRIERSNIGEREVECRG